MEITDIRIRKTTNEIKVKAYCSITFDNCFVVHNVKIMHIGNDTFLAMPSRKLTTGEYKDVAHPITPEFRKLIETKVLEKYNSLEDQMPDRNY